MTYERKQLTTTYKPDSDTWTIEALPLTKYGYGPWKEIAGPFKTLADANNYALETLKIDMTE